MIKEERESNWYTNPLGVENWEVKTLDNGDFEVTYTTEEFAQPTHYKFGEDDFTIEWDHSDEPLGQLYVADERQHHFVMYGNDNEMLVDVDLDTGEIIFGDNYTPDEAAKTFWKAIENYNAPPENAMAGWTLIEDEVGGTEISEELIEDIVKDIQATNFDNSMKGLIDG